MACYHLLLLLLLLAGGVSGRVAGGGGIGFEFHHRFSPAVRQWAEERGHPGAWWPDAGEGSPEYYAALARHDRALLLGRTRRSLAGAGNELLTFALGNETDRISSLGFLHYAMVTVGTPNETFLVALDTGSDVFWVPCDCLQCAPTNFTDIQFKTYSPKLSSTSNKVTCNNSLCDRPNACTGPDSSCPYNIRYLSANTSSSGVLVEDLLYLTREGASSQIVKAPIIFGCGQTQTGSFLDAAAPNGLLGLGMEKISVPSILASKGFTSNTFSMCFGPDGVGRINFGDGGSSNQSETPFIVNDQHPTYNISITSINIENKSIPLDFTAVVDSGTSFTYLNDPAYTQLATNLNAQIRERRLNTSATSSIPFEYCYNLSPNQTSVLLPDVSLVSKNGAVFPVTRPFILLANKLHSAPVGYCLAVLKSDVSINIIGQNFMTGLKVVFDRERLVLGWQKFDCYKSVSTENLPVTNSTTVPAPSAFRPQDTEITGKSPAAAPPRPQSSSSHLNALGSISLMLLLLFAAIL